MQGTMQDVPLTVGRILRHGAERHARSTVVTFDDRLAPSTLHFDEVGQRCAALAHALEHLGVGPGDTVTTIAGNTGEHLEAQLAVPAMGSVIHPVNVRMPPETVESALEITRSRVLLVDPRWTDLAARVAASSETVEHVVVAGARPPRFDLPDRIRVHALEALLDGRRTHYDWPEPDERTAAALVFTSGTSGEPKGVVFTHRSIWLHTMQMCMAESAGLSDADTVLTAIPLAHVLGWGVAYAAFLSGASLVLARARSGSRQVTGADAARLIRDFRPDKAAAMPHVCLGLLRHLERHPQSLHPLREVLVGGSTMPPALYDAFAQRHGVTLLHAWGMTESGPLGTIARPSAHASATTRRAQALSQGRFPAAVEARLVDSQGRVSHEVDAIGEIEIRGPWITGSYLGEADTRKHVVDGWLRTGDIGTISPEGFLSVTDRADDAIRSGGEWISSVELENAVMLDPRVQEAACVGVPDERWGARPLVLVQLAPDADCDARDLWDALEGVVELWKRPDHWAMVEEIPRTGVGKVDKQAIRRIAAEGGYRVDTVRPRHPERRD